MGEDRRENDGAAGVEAGVELALLAEQGDGQQDGVGDMGQRDQPNRTTRLVRAGAQ